MASVHLYKKKKSGRRVVVQMPQQQAVLFLTLSLFFQLWDVRDGLCKQTFTGHESDINAVTVDFFNIRIIYWELF